MTTHGRSGIGRWVVGSVTDKVVRLAGTPTLVIRNQEEAGGQAPPELRRIVLPLDGSFLAEQAVPHAVALAKALGAQVETVRALTMPMYMPAQYPVVGGIPSPGFQPRGEAEKYLEGIDSFLRAYFDS
jgi:nucleotide-binding universal stress UspA family protein